ACHVPQHRYGDRKEYAIRREVGAGEHVVDEEAVNATVPVLERVNKDESERERGCEADRINTCPFESLRHRHPTAHEVWHVFRLRRYEMDVLTVVAHRLTDVILLVAPVVGCVPRI